MLTSIGNISAGFREGSLPKDLKIAMDTITSLRDEADIAGLAEDGLSIQVRVITVKDSRTSTLGSSWSSHRLL